MEKNDKKKRFHLHAKHKHFLIGQLFMQRNTKKQKPQKEMVDAKEIQKIWKR